MLRTCAFWALLAALAAVPGLSGCRRSALDPAADGCDGLADSLLTLCVGQEVRPDAVMRLSFLGVRSDSRCPVDVVCVWAGNAEVEIGVALGMGPTVPYVLNTGLEPRDVTVGATRLTLVELWPAPLSGTTIPLDRYVAALRLDRLSEARLTRN
jgi:hypothetical protein